MELRRLICCSLLSIIALLSLCSATLVQVVADAPAVLLDEQLYSRQIFVYGKSAQQSLSSSHVLVKGSNKPLAAEIVKNLALAGVGKFTIIGDSDTSSNLDETKPKLLLCAVESLAEYAHSLNPLITARDLMDESLASVEGCITVSICAEKSVRMLKDFFTRYHDQKIKHVGCYVRGVSGFVCDDFLQGFKVIDTDGEFHKEIPLADAVLVAPVTTGSTMTPSDQSSIEECSSEGEHTVAPDLSSNGLPQYLDLKMSCIEEERLGLGLGDFAEVVISSDSPPSQAPTPSLGPFEVLRVENSKTAILRVQCADDLQQLAAKIISAVKQGRATIKKTKTTRTIDHSSLTAMLESGSPTFVPTNGCLSDKADRALSLCLLAAVRAADVMFTTDTCAAATVPTQEELEAFQAALVGELRTIGVTEPLNSLKEGGVSSATIEYVAERFLYSVRGGGQCPATVSVVGALAAQEVIKAITQVHVPITQFLMFESLDSVLLPLPAVLSASVSAASEASSATVQVYGEEVAAELARLKVFVVGSGAIGCELLKTFALLGVGTGPVESSSSQGSESIKGVKEDSRAGEGGLWAGLSDGGIVLADMDQIERSNLNRQLLFRERHVGMAKAAVAAESIKEINPRIRVQPAQNKICADTEVIFNSEFWSSVDVVATALDNVDARRYVDAQCVTHGRWMVDSGTLGSKGNTQVVIPFVSESYSSSSDPPEEDIPLCTLKSFPYQPEHCVAWARNKFDQLFSADIKTLRTCLELPALAGPESDDTAALSSVKALLLSSDEIHRLLNTLSAPQTTPKAAVEWAVRAFDSTYRVEAEHLLKEHPMSEVDESGVPFWGGSRRRPVPLAFDPSDAAHRSFVLWAAVLKGRTCGQTDLRSPSDPRLVAAYDELSQGAGSLGPEGEAEATELLLGMGPEGRDVLLSGLCEEEFEKDDAELGHVDFAAAAANLRCRVYSLREVDRLEVQKIAGRIVPALATTTALVAGLAALEIVKIATENILRRRETNAETAPEGSFPGSENIRILKKFRNSFVNLARPLLAFAQAVEAESFSVNNRLFNMWSILEAPKSVSKLTVSLLEEFLQERYGAHLQSVSVRDLLLYADFLPGSEDLLDLPLDALMRRMEAAGRADRELEADDPRALNGDLEPSILGNTDTNSFVDLEVVCVDSHGSDLQLPSVRVHFKPQKQKQKKDAKAASGNRKSSTERREKIGAALSGARNKMFGWLNKA